MSSGDLQLKWNLAGKGTFTIECPMKCNGCDNIEWFETTESDVKELKHSGKVWQFDKSSFGNVSKKLK